MNEINNRNKNIDIYKGICIVFVLINHFGWLDHHRNILLFPFWIDMAVPMFMVISGYVYSRSYNRNEIRTLSECYSFKNILNKILRYTIPFMIIYFIEIIMVVRCRGGMTFADIIKNFLCGGIGDGSYYYPLMIQFIFFSL